MNCLVWGGAGFIGSHLCEALLRQGHTVIAADNLSTGSFRNISAISNPNFRFIRADVCDPVFIPTRLDLIFHLASPASMPAIRRDPLACIAANTVGTSNVLTLARDHGSRVVLASTSEVYGEPEVSPQREDYRGSVNTVGPRSCYDESKRLMETIGYEYFAAGVDVRIIRIFNTYGPRLPIDDGRIIPRFFRSAFSGAPIRVFGDGTATRSFCYVTDQVAAFLAMSGLDRSTSLRVCNVGSEEETSVIKIAEDIVRITGTTSQIVFESPRVDDPTRRQPDISRAKSELNWRPVVTLERGLSLCAEFFLNESKMRYKDY